MRINKSIRAPKVRLIDQNGEQVGVVAVNEAQMMARDAGLDLVEVVPNANPPVCKIIDYGKFRYDQTKREKESKKAQHQIKVKEIKVKPNIDSNDLMTKMKHARDFLSKGNKVKLTCMFRGREMAHPEIGENLVRRICEELEDIASPESFPKRMGRMLTVVLAPGAKKKKESPRPTNGLEL
ncbi:MAG: translation initiation factor IF-3 [Chlamydiales bacterium]|nr:translation initiation factor IF-3 [Chlamydiia bacterium]MCP5508467.1 translation initiation factor IF-3 [Chlamydiales bacterium]